MGCGGGLGHLGLRFAAAMGLRITGVDAGDEPLKLVESLATGAVIIDARQIPAEDVVLACGKEDGKAAIDRGDMGLDAVIILPESQKGFDYGMALLRNHGTCVAVGLPKDGFRVSPIDYVFRDITVKGSILGSRAVLRETVNFAAEDGIKPEKTAFPLSGLNNLVAKSHSGFGGKLVLDMSLSPSKT